MSLNAPQKQVSLPRNSRTFGPSVALEPGTLVWVQDKDGDQVWVKAEVTSIENSRIQVRTDDGEERTLSSAEKLLRCNAATWNSADGLTGVNDLSSLTHLHEPEVLQALQLRFDVDKIYTFCGPILIALNPFKHIDGLYDNLENPEYKEMLKPPPHIFSVASRAFSGLAADKQSQVVLISGESGAGKTETTKHVLKFLTDQLGDKKPRTSSNPSRRDSVVSISGAGTEKKVLSSNPLLEAFGNACTTRNDNSSRFGKFIELQFDERGGHGLQFRCAAIDTYLLEKVRITGIDQQERSYHIFYQACAASEELSAEELQGLPMEYFSRPQDFVYLAKSDRIRLDHVSDAEEFLATRQSMEAMEIPVAEQADIFRIVAAVLHIGNIGVQEATGTVKVDVSSRSCQAVCQILGIQEQALARALTHRLIAVGSERFESPLTLKQAEDRRESFARMIYAFLFNHIVYRINVSLASPVGAGQNRSNGLFIGVLDIFGFEHFKVNSFEQLCINFANERIQKMFNHFVFTVEMDIYKSEGITCDFSDFPDNQGIIDLIQAKAMSIFTLLDEECRMPKGSDKSFVQKLWKTFEKHENFKIEPRKNSSFTVIHFAGPVSYDATNFMDKNMDELGELLKNVIEQSTDPFVSGLLARETAKALNSPSPGSRMAPEKRGGGKLKPHTVCMDFKSQLESLVTKMQAAGPHFVRCIKPNPEKLPDRFDRITAVEQLRSGGVIEALHVQRAGFPCRTEHKACWKDHLRLLFKFEERNKLEAMQLEPRLNQALQQLVKEFKWSAQNPVYAIGKTTVFFKQIAFEAIEGVRITVLATAAKQIQSYWRVYVLRRLYLLVRARLINIQALVRRFLARNALFKSMTPGQLRRSRLFSVDLAGEDDSEDERAAEQEQQRQDQLKATRAEQEQQRREREKQLQEEERRRRQEEEEERRRIEEERLRLEREAEERRQEEMRQKIAQARREGAEEERKKADEALLKAEQTWHEERAAIQCAQDLEVRKLRSEIAEARDAEAALRNEHDVELQRLTREAAQERADMEQQVRLHEVGEAEAQDRIRELETENARLKQALDDESTQNAARIQELEASHRNAMASASEQLELQRVAYLRQMEGEQAKMDEQHRQEQEELRQQEQEHSRRFQEELQVLRDREAAQRKRHDDELAEMRDREGKRQFQFQAQLSEALRGESTADMEMRLLKEEMHNSKVELEQSRDMLAAQQEELKRVHQLQVEVLEQRAAERERALSQEVESLRKQRDSQVASLRAQLDFQVSEVKQTAEQEVTLLRQSFEQRKRTLEQMLEQARLVQEEGARTAEMQLALKLKRQAELQRASEAKASALEESAKRQQELYEHHVEVLTQQMREMQENFRSQLEDAQSENDQRLQASLAQLANVESSIKAQQEQARAQEQQEREEWASKVAQAEGLRERNAGLQTENEALRRQLLEVRFKLLDRPRPRAASSEVSRVPEGRRRASDPAVASFKDFESLGGRRPSLRLQLAPVKLAELSSQEAAAEASQPALRRPLTRRATVSFAVERKRDKLAVDAPVSLGFSRRKVVVASTALAAARGPQRGQLLRPSLQKSGQRCLGETSPWNDIASAGLPTGKPSDGAVTVLCFREAQPTDSHELLAVGCKSGALSIFRIRRTALERGEESEESGGPDVEVVVQRQAHSRAITSLCFCDGGREVVTTSSDWSVQVYSISQDAVLRRFVDTSLVVCAVSLPSPEGTLVTANANNVIQLRGPHVAQQKVRLDHYARSLLLANGGSRLLAGTSRGHIHAFDAGPQGLERRTSQQVCSDSVALTCLVLAPCQDGMPPLLAVNCMDSTVCVLQSNADLTNFTVLRRLSNAHRVLPLRSCHVPGSADTPSEAELSAGFLASGAEDGVVRVFDLESFSEQTLRGHSVPVVDVTVSRGAGLLASGDVHGRVILWRRGARGGQMANGSH